MSELFVVQDWHGNAVSNCQLPDEIFCVAIRRDLIHRVVVWQDSRSRGGNHQTKGISDISGSTRKIYKQKGMGRARHGSCRAPQFRGGAVIFGPLTRDHSFKLNKKVRSLALRSALSMKARSAGNGLILLNDLTLSANKTRVMEKNIESLGIKDKKILIISDNLNFSFVRSVTENMKNIKCLPVEGLNVKDILNSGKVIMSVAAVDEVAARFLITKTA